MTWEFYEGSGRFGQRGYGNNWDKYPAIAVNKGGFTVNAMAAETFGMKAGQYVRVAMHSERRAVGFKVVPNGDSLIGAIKIQPNSGGNKGSKTLKIQCAPIARKIPDCHRRAYRAHLNAGERIIEVDLSPDNMLKS